MIIALWVFLAVLTVIALAFGVNGIAVSAANRVVYKRLEPKAKPFKKDCTEPENPSSYKFLNELKAQDLVNLIERSAIETPDKWDDWGHYDTQGQKLTRISFKIANTCQIFLYESGKVKYRNSYEKDDSKYIEVSVDLNEKLTDRIKSIYNWIVLERLRVGIADKLTEKKKKEDEDVAA